MPSSATTRNRFEKQAAGENDNTWGDRLNSNVIDLIDVAIDGMTSFTLSGSKTLTDEDYAADESRARYLNITSGTGGTVTIPNVEKNYLVRNNTSGNVVFTTGSGTTATVAAAKNAQIVCEAGNVVRNLSPVLGTIASQNTNDVTLTKLTVSGPIVRNALSSPSTSRDILLTDAGGLVRPIGSSSQVLTIQPEATIAHVAGTEIVIAVDIGSAKTIARGAGVSLSFNGTDKDIAIASGGFCVLRYRGTNVWLAWGAGLS